MPIPDEKNQVNKNRDRLLRLPQVLDVVPVSPSGWWRGIQEGRFPRPVKLGPRTTAWRESDIARLIERGAEMNSDDGR